MQKAHQPATIWTIGHSNRSQEEFLALLDSLRIEQIVDIRRFPGSRRQPQFAGEALAHGLAKHRIAYRHLPELGGRRGRPASDSPNTGWRVAQFAAYADHMQTEEFAQGLEALMLIADTRRSAMMCSEAVPWRCHRRLVADALTVRGWKVFDIMARNKATLHTLTDFASVQGGVLTYPGDDIEG
ncbi:Protein of unknown function, DUF488 [Modicisalibacter muralis]|uniref:DUF488 domain-containing protein n=1 Tax=Modicisalibacter muralis TaxID=119000 RepID=A0A1G9LQD0_9GAMM|nr:DUF488 domain-containing protein [Halomonas muralis]SDL63941.1 Protein of unknown function, DUF488 [Halomonas muralis]